MSTHDRPLATDATLPGPIGDVVAPHSHLSAEVSTDAQGRYVTVSDVMAPPSFSFPALDLCEAAGRAGWVLADSAPDGKTLKFRPAETVSEHGD